MGRLAAPLSCVSNANRKAALLRYVQPSRSSLGLVRPHNNVIHDRSEYYGPIPLSTAR